MGIEDSIRDLGAKIYRERGELAAQPVIEGSAAYHRIRELDLAARWNGLALQGVSSTAERR